MIVVGAGPGLGASVARRFAREGLGVSLVARRTSTLAAVQSTLADYDVPVDTYRADAGRADHLERALSAAVEDHGTPEVVVYNAGMIRADHPGDLTVDELAGTWAVNVAGVLVAAMATVPAMRERGRGTFLVTGGMPRPVPSHFSLSLGKAGVRAVTSMLAEHFGHQGVHVATVTVAEEIIPGTRFDPALIADEYWRLHRQEPGDWETELLFDGSS